MKKVLTSYKSFMLKAQTALATGHSSNQLGGGRGGGPGGTVIPLQYKQECAVQVMMSGANQAHWSLVHIRMCSTSKAFHQYK